MKLRLMGAAYVLAVTFGCQTEVPESELAARVDGTPILKTDFQAAVDQTLARYESAGHKLEPRVHEKIRESVLRRLVEHQIIANAAKGNGVELTPEQIEERFEKHKSRWRTEELFQDYLERSRQTVDTMKRELSRTMLRDQVVEKLAGTVTITEEDIKKYYDEKSERFVNKERVRVSHILIPGGDSEAEKRAAAEKAKEVADLASKEGANFADLARKYSEARDKANGGELSWIVRGRMSSQFDTAAFSLEPGAVSAPIETPDGFEVVKVWEKKEEERRELDTVKESIKSNLEARERNRRRREVLKKLKEDAKVETFITFDTPGGKSPSRKVPERGVPSTDMPVKKGPVSATE